MSAFQPAGMRSSVGGAPLETEIVDEANNTSAAQRPAGREAHREA